MKDFSCCHLLVEILIGARAHAFLIQCNLACRCCRNGLSASSILGKQDDQPLTSVFFVNLGICLFPKDEGKKMLTLKHGCLSFIVCD